MLLKEGRGYIQQHNHLNFQKVLAEVMVTPLAPNAHRLRRDTKIGAYISLQSSMVNGIELGYQECRDELFIHYRLEPSDPPHRQSGCGAQFPIYHNLDRKKGGLVTTHQKKLCDGIDDLDIKAFMSSHVRGKLIIHTCHEMQGVKNLHTW